MDEKKTHPAWKLRFTVGAIMLIMALAGMVFTDMKVGGAWLYWRVMAPVYAALSIGLSLYLRHKKLKTVVSTIWHEVLHWVGLLASIYLVYILVQMGFISRFQAGIEVLLLLALATFLVGVYTEPTFIIIGLAQGLLIALIGFLDQYLYFILIPIIGVALLMLLLFSRRKKKHSI